MLKVFLIVLVIIILVAAGSIATGKILFERKINREVTDLFKNTKQVKAAIITEEELHGLPEPIQKYLRYAQIIGKERIATVRLKQKGLFRTKPDQRWMDLEAEQYYTTRPPSFIWKAVIKVAPLFSIAGRDRFENGKGHMLIKLLSLVTLADEKSREMDQGAMQRYLGEMFWFPTAFLEDYIKWEPIDSRSARATMTYKGVSAGAVFYFNEKDQAVKFVADRYREMGGSYTMEKWSTPVYEYKEMNRIKIPVKGEAIWNLKTGDFSYIQLEIVDIEYNIPSGY
ncbi:MAG: DUF6544 family protein [Candidatus Adiutricales bacterium]